MPYLLIKMVYAILPIMLCNIEFLSEMKSLFILITIFIIKTFFDFVNKIAYFNILYLRLYKLFADITTAIIVPT